MIQRCWTNFKLTYDDSAQDQRHLDPQKVIRSKSKPGMINRSSKTQRRDKTGKVDEGYEGISDPLGTRAFQCKQWD